MKVKRITAMVLAALMTSATTSVAFAVQPGEVDDDQVLNFYAGPIGDDLYMMDEDGFIRAAAPGDFALGGASFGCRVRRLDRVQRCRFPGACTPADQDGRAVLRYAGRFDRYA